MGLQREPRTVGKIDILIISRDYPPEIGGVASHVRDLALGLGKIRKVEKRQIYLCIVDVVASIQESATAVEVQKSRQPNLRLHSMSSKSTDGDVPFAHDFDKCVELWTREGQSTSRMGKLLRPRHWDVIHAHDAQSASLGMLLKAALRTPIQPKLFVTVHRLPKGVGSAIRRNVKEAYVASAREFGLVDRFIVPSNACKKTLEESSTYGYPSEKVDVIHHGVWPQRLRSETPRSRNTLVQDLNIGDEEIVVFCPARLDSNKGITTLVDAAGVVLNRLPHKKLRFVVAGNGTQARTPDEMKYTEQVKAHSVVQAHPAAFSFGAPSGADFSASEMFQMFRRAQLCVLPSEWENFPVALLEAAVFRVPVIASNVGGIREIVDDDKTGLLVHHGHADLARAILEMVTNEYRAKILADASFVKVTSEFSALRMAQNHLRVYETVAGVKVRGWDDFAEKQEGRLESRPVGDKSPSHI
jgi:glycosyltransferase involved in cell wall biosynthesis